MRKLLFILLLIAILITSGCITKTADSNVTLTRTSALLSNSTDPTISTLTTLHEIQNTGVNNNPVEYRTPEKIINTDDVQIGDLIQRSVNDSLYNEQHGFIIANITSENEFLLQEIVRIQKSGSVYQIVNNGRWYGIEPENQKLITSGALRRDYPYKIGHASEPLPQICMVFCGFTESCSSNSEKWNLGCGDENFDPMAAYRMQPPTSGYIVI